MGEFNSDEHYIYYCGQESLRRNGVAIIVNKGDQNAVLGCCLKNDLGLLPRQTIQHHSNPTLCPTTNDKEAEVEWFYEDLQGLLELTPKEDFLIITGDWNAKVGSQETPGVQANLALECGMKQGKD